MDQTIMMASSACIMRVCEDKMLRAVKEIDRLLE